MTMSESEEENAASTRSDNKVDFEDTLALWIDTAFPLDWRGLCSKTDVTASLISFLGH